jgi:hypothetical protein
VLGRYEGGSGAGAGSGGGGFAACMAAADDYDVVWSAGLLTGKNCVRFRVWGAVL